MYGRLRHLKTFIAECHRRRVFRVAALYILGAWIVLQVAELAFSSWGIPTAALRYVWIGAALGFPVALIFGWRFDIVGGQIIHTPDSATSTDLSLRRADYLILTALATMIVATIFGVGGEIYDLRLEHPDDGATSINPNSIAVLPFLGTSSDQESADFLAIGIQDDLLTRLSKIGSLKVISRTSVERYRGKTNNIRRIASELGVGKILEGGVQRIGDQIRVNVQLINTVTDEHLWAETYDRSLTAKNVFTMQSEIVETIVRQLQASLTPQEAQRVSSMPTQDIAAYTVYLRGRNQADVESIESLHSAIESFNAAIELDPDFALAYVGLSDAYLWLGSNFYGGLPLEEGNALAEPPVMRALELDPGLGEAHATLGLLRQLQGDLPSAEQAFERAISLQPSYPRVFRLYGRLRWQQQRRDEGIALLHEALKLDPFSAPVNFDLSRMDDLMGRFDEALAGYLRVVEIEPNHAFAYVYIAAIHFMVYGRADESLVWYHKAAQNDVLSPSLQAAQSVAYLELGDVDSARMWVERSLELGSDTFWALWSSVLLNLYTGDDVAAQRHARSLLEKYPTNWGALHVLRNADIAAGRYDAARSRYARAHRELTEPEVPQVDDSNYVAALDLALVLMHLGEQERADDLLAGSLKTIESLSRLGTDGYWISDVRIYALQQRPELALAALRQAMDEGWQFLTWFYLDNDPNLDSIRDDPEFKRLYAEIKSDLAIQARRVRDLKASGDIGPVALLDDDE